MTGGWKIWREKKVGGERVGGKKDKIENGAPDGDGCGESVWHA